MSTAPPCRRCDMIACLIALVFATGCPLHADTVYKSTDAEGHVVYSDRADASAEKAVIQVDRPDSKEVARNVHEQQLLKADDLQRKIQESAAARKHAQLEHDKQLQCEAARSRYYALKDARRVFQRDADGNRVYYSDTEADAKREEAQQAMMTACGT